MHFGETSNIIFLIISSICAVTDTAKRHIDNKILLAGTITTAIAFFIKAPNIEIRALALMLLFVFVLLFTFVMGFMGGGDVKLYAFLTFSMPNEKGLNVMIFSMLLAAAYGIIYLLADGLFFQEPDLLQNGFCKKNPDRRSSKGSRHSIPMALFIFIAALILTLKGGNFKWIG